MVINEEAITAPGSDSDEQAAYFAHRREEIEARHSEAQEFLSRLCEALSAAGGSVRIVDEEIPGIYALAFNERVVFTLWYEGSWHRRVSIGGEETWHCSGGIAIPLVTNGNITQCADAIRMAAKG